MLLLFGYTHLLHSPTKYITMNKNTFTLSFFEYVTRAKYNVGVNTKTEDIHESSCQS